jgi:hypothetical protein
MKPRSTLTKFILIAAALAAGFCSILVTSTASEAKSRPTISGAMDCFADLDATAIYVAEANTDDKISYCCYDDGCWICDAALTECVWENKGRVSGAVRYPPAAAVGSNHTGTESPPGRTGLPPITGGGVAVYPMPPKGSGAPTGVIVDPVHGIPPKGTGVAGGVTVYPMPPKGSGAPTGVIVDPVHGIPPKGGVGIAPVQVAGTKQPGSGQSPVTIFKGNRGIGGRFGSNPVPVVGLQRSGASAPAPMMFARAGGHRH